MKSELTKFANLPTKFGKFKASAYKDAKGVEHLVLMRKNKKTNVLTRIQSECLTGEVFGSKRCDCRDQLDYAMRKADLIIYLRQEGRGHGLFNKLRAYVLQDKGLDTVESAKALGLPVDAREYKVAGEILKKLKIKSICLLTNNPNKANSLKGCKIGVKCVTIPWSVNTHNKKYLKTKQEKMGHL